jgi:hypothetical protein
MSDSTTQRAEFIRETTRFSWEYACLIAEDERDLSGRDAVRHALIGLELAILPHVEHDAERTRRLRRVDELRAGMPGTVQCGIAADLMARGL